MNLPDTQRAFEFFQLQKYEHAREEAQRCIAVDPNDGQAFAVLSMAASQLGEFPYARDTAKEAIRIAPDLHVGYFAMAKAVIEDEHFEPKARAWGVRWHYLANRVCAEIAIRYLNDAIAIAPNISTLHGYKALALKELGKLNEALVAARRGLVQDANDEICHSVTMLTLYQIGNTKEAVAAARLLLRIAPENTAAHSLLAEMGIMDGRGGNAAEHAKTAVRQSPENRGARYRHDLLGLRLFDSLSPLVRFVHLSGRLARTWPRWLMVFVVCSALATTMRVYADPLQALPIAVVVITVMYLVLMGVFTELVLASVIGALRRPGTHDRFAQWLGNVGFVCLYFVPMLALIGMWYRAHVFWGLIVLLGVLGLFRSTQALAGRGDDLIPYDWDLIVATIINIILGPASLVAMFFLPVNYSVFTVLPWLILSIAMMFLPNIVHGIEEVDGRFVTYKDLRQQHQERVAQEKAQLHQQRQR